MNKVDIASEVAFVARTFYRPDAVDATAMLARIEAHLIARSTSPSIFGRKAINDPCFVFDLRKGRRVTRRTASRIDAYLAKEA
ncbi:hypothetical protein [Sphingobium yanoikuyae]|uniref:Uncharacterized protein n=1 Tax=Sphingobium yanoikuyae TaxID=13690 RepID=A0A9X7UJU8_SPHYA|nr:hypothetical protein [Sphingobium yanoikuyae]QNG49327.1 hypothetical protein H3V42_24800 [Sphingobium yanoikuyae]